MPSFSLEGIFIADINPWKSEYVYIYTEPDKPLTVTLLLRAAIISDDKTDRLLLMRMWNPFCF